MKIQAIMREVFGLLVRAVGLYFVYMFSLVLVELFKLLFSGFKGPQMGGVFWAAIYNGALALWFISGAPPVVDLAYPRNRQRADKETPDGEPPADTAPPRPPE